MEMQESESSKRRGSTSAIFSAGVKTVGTDLTEPSETLEEADGLVYASREGLFDVMMDETDDQLRVLSESYYQICAFLTYKPVIQIFFPISFFISVMIGIGSFYFEGAIGSPSLLAIAILANYLPVLHAKVITNSYMGQSKLLGNPFAFSLPRLTSLVHVGGEEEGEVEEDTQMPTSTKSRSIFTSEQETSVYHMASSIILFNLKLKQRRVWDDGVAKPLISDNLWNEVEARANLGFFSLVTYTPRVFFSLAAAACLVLWVFVDSIGTLMTHGPPTTAFGVATHFYQWLSFLFWSYGTGLIGGLWALYLLTLHAHHFQITLLKVRLEHDRLHNEDSVPQWQTCRLFIEEYLFHQRLIKRSGEAWQVCIVVSLLGTFLYFIAGLAGFILYKNVTPLLLGMTCIVFFLFVLYFIAALNSELASIRAIFVTGSREDWKRYGGREELLKYIDSNPIAFHVFGFEITFKLLVGLTTSVVGANFGAILAVVGVAQVSSSPSSTPSPSSK